MQNQAFLYGVIGLLGGSLLTIMVTSSAVNNQNVGMMQMMGMGRSAQRMMETSEINEEETGGGHMGMGSSMTEMMESLDEKTGDTFDKAFIEAMTAHHEGAIEMAKLAQKNAGHEEIKNLADDIITAQTSEISLMRQWLTTWEK